ncbi:MAG: endo alpha-1,4 polygalactosaminidase [Oscillospiraceae bacterium]|nr:endo alpha-1,4 polygalactosaminidase [Oscillospiraceae bacterium]
MKRRPRKCTAWFLAVTAVLLPLSVQSAAFPPVFAAESGDITGDGKFDADDIQNMQKWLLGNADANPADWKAADCDKNKMLDARDFTMMKRAYSAPAAYSDTSYGVFLGIEPEDISRTLKYDTIVIDAQYYTPEQIAELHKSGHTVFSYINIGSVEDFRPYYNDYVSYTIGDYENWDEERWVDVSQTVWQDFILKKLAPEILAKGVDGLFVDNADVYYFKQTKEIFNGVADILKGLQAMDTYVSINGGDTFVMDYIEKGGKFSDVADAVNQETVFSKIEWEKESFSRNDDEERAYFQEYVETVAANGGDIYLLEYTKDAELIKQIAEYCRAHHFRYYVSGTLELL